MSLLNELIVKISRSYNHGQSCHLRRDPYEFSDSDSDFEEEEDDKKAKKKKKKKVCYPLQ